MTADQALRWATVAVCAWAAVAIATNRPWTVSATIDRTARLHPWLPYAVWAGLGVAGLAHGHDMRRRRRA